LLTLPDLVANNTISTKGAEVLGAIAASGRSFLVHALPQNAGKSTLTEAILAEVPSTAARHEFYGTEHEAAALAASPTRGYLLVAEMGHRGRPGYLANEEIVRVFDLVHNGYALASSLHADSVEEVFDVLRRNGVPTPVAAAIPYLIKVRVLGNPKDSSAQRVVESIHEIRPSDDGGYDDVPMYEWDGLS
jgi:type IV secretory pathway ATPase VirB11/archaellum biosynthesis ATPase